MTEGIMTGRWVVKHASARVDGLGIKYDRRASGGTSLTKIARRSVLAQRLQKVSSYPRPLCPQIDATLWAMPLGYADVERPILGFSTSSGAQAGQ